MGEQFTPGAIVHARGREWVVLPSDDKEVLRLRPLTSSADQVVGLFMPLEGKGVKPATFAHPEPSGSGDATGVLTLFDAARLSLRAGAAPFRSLGRISVTPRPYQFVPLIMALRLDPVRLLIADDVGVGKTIEAGMVARELLDRGLAKRVGVLCPAHLCDQWQRELSEKFGIDTALVQPSNFARLERALPRQDVSVYQHYPNLVCSIDFVKSDRHRPHFLAHAPDLIIVDEAHMAARPPSSTGRSEQQRHDLLRALNEQADRHLVLVTATPHSGVEESFRSLLGLLNSTFDTAGQLDHKQLLPHVIQRRRADVENWLGADTPFPERKSEELHYELSEGYRALFNDVLEYCRDSLADAESMGQAQRRVRHWAAIALLRCALSSPAAAEGVLRRRQDRLDDEQPADDTSAQVDETYRPQVSDALDDEETGDYVPGGLFQEDCAAWTQTERRRLSDFRRRAERLAGIDHDRKLFLLAQHLRRLLRKGHKPIVFCRFIDTAKYLGRHLPNALGREFKKIELRVVTGEIGDEERRERVAELAEARHRLLVATDCLSEGINLQKQFDAVIHYDLPWNPNRLEQREGRVDRYGQPREAVQTALIYGSDNPVDQVVLDILLRKARTIRSALGIAVPVPVAAEEILQTVVDNVLLRQADLDRDKQLELALATPEVSRLHQHWDEAANREREDRAFFAQSGIQPDEVDREVKATDAVLGDADAVQRFLADALQRFNGRLRASDDAATFEVIPGDLRQKLAPAVSSGTFPVSITTDRQRDTASLYVGRTHPLVSLTCDAVLGRAFAPDGEDLFTRTGAMRTRAVASRTVLLLLRLRYLMREKVDEFAEEVVLAAFQREDGQLRWLEPFDSAGRNLAEQAQAAGAAANIAADERIEQVNWALEFMRGQDRWWGPLVDRRVEELQDANNRLRGLLRADMLTVEPHEPPDILGCFVLLPANGGS